MPAARRFRPFGTAFSFERPVVAVFADAEGNDLAQSELAVPLLGSGERHAALGLTSLAIFEAMVFCATFGS